MKFAFFTLGCKMCIRDRLYLSKLYLNTADLFAWSLVIILLSLALERLLVFALATVQRKWGIAA